MPDRRRPGSFGPARAIRYSRRPGQRCSALAALAEAAKIRRTPELRDEAIACLALPDMRPVRIWPPGADLGPCVDPSFTLFAMPRHDGTLSIRRTGDDREIQRLPPAEQWPAASFLRFSPDHRHLAAAYLIDGDSHHKFRFRFYRIGRDEPVLIHEGPASGSGFDFSPTGRRIVIAHYDGSVRLHDLDSGRVHNPQQFFRAVNQFGTTFNWPYIDNRHIAYFSSGRLPVMAPGSTTTPGAFAVNRSPMFVIGAVSTVFATSPRVATVFPISTRRC